MTMAAMVCMTVHLVLQVDKVMGANCFCKTIPLLYTADCCKGLRGQIRMEGALHCHFDDYIAMANFNRCCDSYYGMGRCTIG